MPKRGRHRRGGRTTPKGTRPFEPRRGPAPRSHEAGADDDLMVRVRVALADEHPLGLLALVSSMLATLGPRAADPFERDVDAHVTWDELQASFLDVDRVETSALLAVAAEMRGDEVARRRIARELAARDDELPRWVDALGGVKVERVMAMTDVLGDGDEVLLGARLPDGDALTAAVYIDHNLGTVAKDGFVIPDAVERVVAVMDAHRQAEITWIEIDPADARARITEAIDVGAMTYPPYETDTWPACRALVEWLVRTPGGRARLRATRVERRGARRPG